MKALAAALICLGVGLAGTTLAQEKKAPAAAQKKQQSRLGDCSRKAGSRQGRERQEFISSCLKGAKAPRKR
jgi:hypothetical protein